MAGQGRSKDINFVGKEAFSTSADVAGDTGAKCRVSFEHLIPSLFSLNGFCLNTLLSSNHLLPPISASVKNPEA